MYIINTIYVYNDTLMTIVAETGIVQFQKL